MSEDGGLLTHAAATWPSWLTHAIARLLGITAALKVFCPCGTCGEGE